MNISFCRWCISREHQQHLKNIYIYIYIFKHIYIWKTIVLFAVNLFETQYARFPNIIMNAFIILYLTCACFQNRNEYFPLVNIHIFKNIYIHHKKQLQTRLLNIKHMYQHIQSI